MATSPQYAAIPKIGATAISTANTARDGSGTIGTVFSAGASGSRVERVVIKATASTTAGIVRIFLHDGSSARLISEVPVQAITVSANVPSFETEVIFEDGMVLPTGYSLRASTHNAENFNVVALGADL